MTAQEIRAALDRHWIASDASDFETEHDIYLEDAVLEYPQSGERIRGRRNIQITRTNQASKKRFTVRRVIGSGDLWITEYILTRMCQRKVGAAEKRRWASLEYQAGYRGRSESRRHFAQVVL